MPLPRLPVVLLAAFALGSCSLLVPPRQIRGNPVSAAELVKLHPGRTTEAEASRLLGSPTAKGTFNQNDWYYISEVTRQAIGRTQAVLNQGVVVLHFAANGVLTRVQRIGRKQALSAPIVARTTPSPGGSAGFFQQLLGNVGRFGPGPGGGGGGGSVGGAPTQ
ncbi:MAG: outer membrane protein assembly factor BamE [Acetobacteraceae bacterium]